MYHPPRRKRVHVTFEPDVHQTLKDLCSCEKRSMSDELAYLVMERATELDLARQLPEKGR